MTQNEIDMLGTEFYNSHNQYSKIKLFTCFS